MSQHLSSTPAAAPSAGAVDSPVPAEPGADADVDDLPEQLRIRRAKRERLLQAGTQPYPVSVPRTHDLGRVRQEYGSLEAGEETDDVVAVAGRVVFVRNTGKLCFATLQSGDGTRLQVMLGLAAVGADALQDWKDLVDLGDHVSVQGRVGASRRGELSVFADSWQLASKALRPLPVLHKPLSEEARVRLRYVDLVVREEARAMVRTRSTIMRVARDVLDDQGYTEIETPVLQLVQGGAHARPFRTHLNAFDQAMTLRIALELHLKRAVVGGIERVYEIGRVFRNEGIDSSHSPEFTMLEAYAAYGDQVTVADLLRDVVQACADALGGRQVTTPDGVIDLDGAWAWRPFYPTLSEALGRDLDVNTPRETLAALAEQHEVAIDPAWSGEKIALELFGEIVEPTLLDPTFVHDYPASAQPLARPHRTEPGLIEAWDLIVGGSELGTGFSELIDPVIQRERFEAQSAAAAAGDPEAMHVDEDFLRALEYGAPPMGGLGFGVDRLVRLFTGAGIRETILFPLLKPEAGSV